MDLAQLRINSISKVIALNEKFFFYPKLKKVYRELLGDEIKLVFDVGANKGQSIEFFKKLNSGMFIVSFEASPTTFRNLEAAGFENVVLENLGVSDRTGEMEFYECVLDETSSFALPDFDSKYLRKKARILGIRPENLFTSSSVKVVTLDDYMQEKSIIDIIDVLKIDVEGHELEVIMGARKLLTSGKVKFIQLEQHSNDMRSSNQELIDQFLENMNYFKVAKVPHGFGDFQEIIYMNSK